MSQSASRKKVLQSLTEVHALEAALASTLTAHIALTPRGAYRDLLVRHRQETLAQRERVQERLLQLGVGRSPLALLYGVAQTVTGQVLSLGKTPLDLLRGSSGEEKLLKNAKDEAASEALEIATYDALEALANRLGDPKTAVLAREHRTQEEEFLRELRVQIGLLAAGTAEKDVHGTSSYKLSQTGVLDAARKVARTATARAGAAATDAKDAAPAHRDAPAGAGRAAETPAATAPGTDEIPIRGYDASTIEQILPKLRSLSTEELARIDGYERAGRARKRILDRVAALRTKKLDEELSAL